MWDKVKELTPEQHKEWFNAVTPCTGQVIDFRGVHVIDIDVAEALEYMIEEHSQEKHVL
jgi:hypothetical protein